MDSTKLTTKGIAAVSYAEQGYRVLLIAPSGKNPIQSNWPELASSDVQLVASWWTKHPEANVGLLTGSKANLIVLDLDGEAGLKTLEHLEAEHGLINTRRIKTPHGIHLYFSDPPTGVKNAVKLLPGMDLRSDNGCVVAPPSTVDGALYEIVNSMEPAPCPTWVWTLVKAQEKAPAKTEISPTTLLDGVAEGGRNDAVFKFACRLIRQYRLPVEAVQALALIKGARCTPPLPDSEVLLCVKSAENTTCSAPVGITAIDLGSKEITPPKWLIQNLLPGGITILAGRPKSGKSFAALGLAISVAQEMPAFGTLTTTKAGVLYLGLEDTQYRLKDRMEGLLGDSPPPTDLHFFTSWPNQSTGGAGALETWLQSHPSVGLVVLDTLAAFRTVPKANANAYHADYDAITALKVIADGYGVSILVLHHLRKAGSADPFDAVSGTLGLTGAADAIWILRKDGNQGTLHMRGRDLEDGVMSLSFDGGTWNALTTTATQPTNAELKLLTVMGTGSVTADDIAEKVSGAPKSIAKTLQRMFKKGLVTHPKPGVYQAIPPSGIPTGGSECSSLPTI